ncbi:hypothetical protein HN51_008784 [Arachis hypogaea]|uniref:Protein kinase domain-containing protein n=1 Tax=Arachis hypogaea TaxID=3818 RepID=A0A445D226_ARAHY|nr:LEAF RUST 10 DISEASE-RESISTANCE LOCUS RECEPTOR-LIKE PROTEIN KINASE-like 1.2 [Arachis hypogaea]QHO43136.1 uncharacterized protein DS421_5g160240 [Arachis hypogaea]QHO43137.1 uncharacterized protein DS421_5g160240 [Arachis hypogaea]RYR57242.1 hypothetical protein Ahy_A05g022976 isoform A [Arachis hypogaea]RYR57243.1 hypothetical protein Ahy_A05g022976 isoform B [Arachis hypogaea]RYR57244.1 hypothetical protein Ahy_A05g022976 isoform C [Arachis hypogaea]
MPILSFVSQCFFFPNGSGSKHHTLHPIIGSEVKGGSKLVPLDSEEPSSGDDEQHVVPLDSKVQRIWDEPMVPVISDELPSDHDQNQSLLLVDSVCCHINEVFEYSELEEATNNFDPSRKLGSGGYGTVYFGILKDGRHVAIKQLHKDMLRSLRLHDENSESNDRVTKFSNEFAILSHLKHGNLVQLYGCTSPQSHEVLLVQEYIPNGTAADHLLNRSSPPWSTRLNIAIQTAEALAYLHSSSIIHRNVKTSNILLDINLNAKVADFGLSRLFPEGVTHVSTDPAGTPGYVDPEYYEHGHLSEKSDVYSFGVILLELITSLPAYSEDDREPFLSNFAMVRISCGRLQSIVDRDLGFESDDWNTKTITAVAELACKCLQSQSKLRPSMEEVLNSLVRIKSC